jgi:hypothetical protein
MNHDVVWVASELSKRLVLPSRQRDQVQIIRLECSPRPGPHTLEIYCFTQSRSLR